MMTTGHRYTVVMMHTVMVQPLGRATAGAAAAAAAAAVVTVRVAITRTAFISEDVPRRMARSLHNSCAAVPAAVPDGIAKTAPASVPRVGCQRRR